MKKLVRNGHSDAEWARILTERQDQTLRLRRGEVLQVGLPGLGVLEPAKDALRYTSADFARMAELVLQEAAEEDVKPEGGFPSVGGGFSTGSSGSGTYDADNKGRIARPDWLSTAVMKVIDSAMTYNPDAAHAVWIAKMVGLAHPTMLAYKIGPGGVTEDVDPEATAMAYDLVESWMSAYGGGLQAILEVGLDSTVRRGAVGPELDVADSLDFVQDMDFVRPEDVDFVVVTDGVHRKIAPYYMGGVQGGGGEPKLFNPAQFAYFGINKRVGGPHGMTPFMGLVETAPRQAGFRKGMERVAATSAWSKVGLQLAYDRAARSMPEDVVQVSPDGGFRVVNGTKFKAEMDRLKDSIIAASKRMYEDDVWVYWDLVEPKPISAEHGGSLPFDAVGQLFDTDGIISLHSQPAMHGRSWGNALSSQGDVQWVVSALGWEALRDYPARAVTWSVNQAFKIMGIAAEVELSFRPIRMEDRLAEAQAALIETERLIKQRDEGWIDNDEAAQDATGHGAVGEPTPASERGASQGLGLLGQLPGAAPKEK